MPSSVDTVSPPSVGNGDDLAVEASLVARRLRELLRTKTDLVELLAGDIPLLRDHLGGDPLRHVVETRGELLGEREARSVLNARSHRNARHRLDAASDHDVVRARLYTLGAEVDGLLRRTALSVDARTGNLDGETGRKPVRYGRR